MKLFKDEEIITATTENIVVLTIHRIHQEFEKEKAGWKKGEKGLVLTDEQAKLRIAASLYMEIWSRSKFRIKEGAAFDLFKIKINAI